MEHRKGALDTGAPPSLFLRLRGFPILSKTP
jgi:hypothetical protein